MNEAWQRYRTVSEGFSARVDGVRAEQWELPTPCTEWTVRDVLGHVLQVQEFTLGLIDRVPPAAGDGDQVRRWHQLSGTLLDALGDEEIAHRVVTARTGEQPFGSVAGGMISFDTLTHTWDIARATGQDETIDAASAAAGLEMLHALGDIRGSGAFAAEVESAPDADVATRFLNYTGRTV